MLPATAIEVEGAGAVAEATTDPLPHGEPLRKKTSCRQATASWSAMQWTPGSTSPTQMRCLTGKMSSRHAPDLMQFSETGT